MTFPSPRRLMIRAACLAGALAAIVLVAACGGSSASSDTSAAATAASTAASSGAHATVDARTGPLGSYLVDGSGRTLYYFAADAPGTSNCYGVCAAGWPVVTVTRPPTAGPGVNASKLGTITRADKTTQVTFDGMPLYRFVLDATAGDIYGQDLPAFGGPWWMVDPTSGTAITTTPPPLPAATPPAAPAAVTIRTHRGSLGTYLTDGSGKTLYRFDGDRASTSACTGLCAEVWPPVLVENGPTAGDGVTPGPLGTITRKDGTRQVTYDHAPLYYFALDGGKAGVTNGQGQKVAGDTWWVVSPAGRTITTPIPANGPAAPSASSTTGGAGR
jgi:predicted lipoprotein with Yx(FWY)xxD motif